MKRRQILQALGAGALAASFPACAPTPQSNTKYSRPYSRKPWAAPKVSMDDVIRTVVGHRPYRPSGFVVKRESFDDKIVVHNYGHAGGGISLSWGSSALAVRETGGLKPGRVAVMGSGVMGLTSARLLQDAGWNVTIYTRNVARHSTSNVAAGQWSPFGVYDPSVASDEFIARFNWAARIAHHAYTNLGGSDYGVRWIEQYDLSSSAAPFPGNDLDDLFPYKRTFGPGEHPFPTDYAHGSVTMLIEPAVLLRRLLQDFRLAGGKVIVREFVNLSDVLTLDEPVIFNCTGLGAARLFGDQELTPAKGQLVFLPPDPAVDYLAIGGGRGFLYMFPRTDVVLLGGTYQLGDYSTQPDPDETERIVSEHTRIYSAFDA